MTELEPDRCGAGTAAGGSLDAGHVGLSGLSERLLPIGGFAVLDASVLPRRQHERRMAFLGPALSLIWMVLLVPAALGGGGSTAALLLRIGGVAAFLVAYAVAFFDHTRIPDSPAAIRGAIVCLFLLFAALTVARPGRAGSSSTCSPRWAATSTPLARSPAWRGSPSRAAGSGWPPARVRGTRSRWR